MYTPQIMDHFKNPRNVGEVQEADGIGEANNAICGDLTRITIRVENGRLTDVRFKTRGCGVAIATSSMATELAKGRTLAQALQLTSEVVARSLGGLPPNKVHCSRLATIGLHAAIANYYHRHPEAQE